VPSCGRLDPRANMMMKNGSQSVLAFTAVATRFAPSANIATAHHHALLGVMRPAYSVRTGLYKDHAQNHECLLAADCRQQFARAHAIGNTFFMAAGSCKLDIDPRTKSSGYVRLIRRRDVPGRSAMNPPIAQLGAGIASLACIHRAHLDRWCAAA